MIAITLEQTTSIKIPTDFNSDNACDPAEVYTLCFFNYFDCSTTEIMEMAECCSECGDNSLTFNISFVCSPINTGEYFLKEGNYKLSIMNDSNVIITEVDATVYNQ